MKAVKWFGPRDMRMVDVPQPSPKPHEAMIRIESVGVCGSDMHYYLDGHIGSAVITEPLILGHEFAGIVEAVGSEADPSLIGKRVAVEPSIPCGKCEWCLTGHYNVCTDLFFPGGPPYDGVLCEYAAYDARYCFPVPDGMTAQVAAMIEPLAVAVHTVELARMRPGDTVAILGLGPIGLLTAQMARHCGAGQIIGTDLLDYRVEAGLRFGADMAFNAGKEDTVARIMEITGRRGVDIVFDCARSTVTPSLACRVARPAGRCVFTGISGSEEDPLAVSAARRKELNIQWCRRFLHNFPTAIQMAHSGKIDVASLVTHSFPLEKTHEAFDLVADSRDNVLKASIDY
jgi:L-iditol 2-dehydrogenase